MRRTRWLCVFTVLLMALAAPVAQAHPEGPGHHMGPPGPLMPPATERTLPLLGAVNPGPGATGDVYGFKRHAYLASWVGVGCLSKGIRVYDLDNPRRPRLASVFADAASDPAVAGTWTEKVIVQHVRTREFTGDLAVVSFQTCGGVFSGFGLYDVTDPENPRKLALFPTPGTGGSHEIWLGASRGRAYVYTAVIDSELITSPDYDPETD